MQGNGAHEPRRENGNAPTGAPLADSDGRPKAGASATQAESARDRAAEASSPIAAEEATQEVDGGVVEFDALRNAAYHTARADHYSACHRWLMFAVVAAGTAGVTSLLDGFVGPKLWGAATAILAALDLVMNLKAKASQHERLKQEYFNLLATIVMTTEPDAAEVRRWRGQIVRLTAEEPQTYKGVDAIVYNNAADALGYGREQHLEVPRHVRIFARFWAFSGYSFDLKSKS